MAIDIKNQQELEHTLNEIWKFHERVPEFSGSEVDADILLRRLNATDVPITADNLQQTYEELKWAGLLQDNEPTPPPQTIQVEAPLVDDDAKYDAYEIELAPNVELKDLSVDGILDSLSPDKHACPN